MSTENNRSSSAIHSSFTHVPDSATSAAPPPALMGLKAEARTEDSSSPQNLRLWRKLRRVEKLPPAQRRTVVQLIDALVEGKKRKKQRT